MNIDNIVPIGKIYQAYSLKGEMKVFFEAFFIEFIDQLEVIFLKDKQDGFLPYFVETVVIRNDMTFILKLEGIDVKEQATELSNKEIFVDRTPFEELEEAFEESNYWDYIIGFEALDGDKNIGKVDEILYMGEQDLAQIIQNEKEHLIPLHDDFIIEVNEDAQRIIFELPEGLLEL